MAVDVAAAASMGGGKRHFRGHLYYANEPLFRSSAVVWSGFMESTISKVSYHSNQSRFFCKLSKIA